MNIRLSLREIFLSLLLVLILFFPASAMAQTAPVCGSGGPVTPGTFVAELLPPGSFTSTDSALFIMESNDVPPLEVWLDPGTAGERLIMTSFDTSESSLFVPLPGDPDNATHVIAFVTQGFAPVCFTVSLAQPSPIPVLQDAYPVQPATLPVLLPSTGILLLPLAGGAACAGIGSLLLHRRSR